MHSRLQSRAWVVVSGCPTEPGILWGWRELAASLQRTCLRKMKTQYSNSSHPDGQEHRANRPSLRAAGRHREQMADSLRSREARLRVNPHQWLQEEPFPPKPHMVLLHGKKCVVCEVDQDAASQNAALLRNGLSLRGKEKPNRMFIFYNVKKKKKEAGLQG